MTEDVRTNSQSSDSNEIARVLRQIGETGVMPSDVDSAAFLRRLYTVWVENGGEVAGKPRNSLRRLTELLAQRGVEVPSLQPKLAGHTRVTEKDATALIELILSHWDYVGPPKATEVTSDHYQPFLDLDISKIRDLLIKALFSRGGVESRRGIHLPPRDLRKREMTTAKESRGTILELYNQSNVLITVSSHRTIIAPTPVQAIAGTRNTMTKIWQADKENNINGILLWIVDVGSRHFNDDYALSAFYNVDFLETQFRALAIFDDVFAKERWRWLQARTIFVVGSLQPDEIDACYGDEEPGARKLRTKWPWITAEQILISALPDRWVKAPQLRVLYGQNLEDMDKRAFTVFYREAGWRDPTLSTVTRRDLRYFAYGPDPEVWSRNRTAVIGEASAKTLELPSPDERYDEAFRIVCAAARRRLHRPDADGIENVDPVEALAQLRHLGFAVMRLGQFLNLSAQLSTSSLG